MDLKSLIQWVIVQHLQWYISSPICSNSPSCTVLALSAATLLLSDSPILHSTIYRTVQSERERGRQTVRGRERKREQERGREIERQWELFLSNLFLSPDQPIATNLSPTIYHNETYWLWLFPPYRHHTHYATTTQDFSLLSRVRSYNMTPSAVTPHHFGFSRFLESSTERGKERKREEGR